MANRSKKTKGSHLTIASALEAVYKAGSNSELSEEFFNEIAQEAMIIQSKLSLSGDAKTVMIKAVIIAFAIDQDGSFSVQEVAHFLGMSNISFFAYSKILVELCNEDILNQERSTNGSETRISYSLPYNLVECIRDDRKYIRRDMSKMTPKEFLNLCNKWLQITDNAPDYYVQMVHDIRTLIENTQHLHLSKELLSLGLDDDHIVMFLICATKQILCHQRCIGPTHYEDIFMCTFMCDEICHGLDDQTDILSKLNLMENDCTDGIADPGDYLLTSYACETLLRDYHYVSCSHKKAVSSNLILPESIHPKELFYNCREGAQVERLTSLMMPENLESVQRRLADSGLRTGMCILFHGAAPGTGKTATVLEICRKTGHPIMRVDMASVKSKWVGDSEKNLQKIFDDYRKDVMSCRKNGTPIPVLMLNEADALIGHRFQGSEMTSVDKMMNTMQNIILQNMEDLDGVLIATTNLAANFDKANERRWLMNIHFEKPEAMARMKILLSMIPELSEAEANQLAEEFPAFAGGQYENITRRLKIEQIINDTPFSFELVHRLCLEEGITKGNKDPRTPIGFC